MVDLPDAAAHPMGRPGGRLPILRAERPGAHTLGHAAPRLRLGRLLSRPDDPALPSGVGGGGRFLAGDDAGAAASIRHILAVGEQSARRLRGRHAPPRPRDSLGRRSLRDQPTVVAGLGGAFLADAAAVRGLRRGGSTVLEDERALDRRCPRRRRRGGLGRVPLPAHVRHRCAARRVLGHHHRVARRIPATLPVARGDGLPVGRGTRACAMVAPRPRG